ncbi:hypothetical protein M404DRAFT_15844 [Pisolithus tinctorius Marx 270]|uniref:F-box domain-containing protein n=1 Tax=Pisolithus tinctorius Marx 270 TaxID=870435 RepID=A0A0C3JZ44_PISTI|nr:hypothetical protein M404DRAFT_15844 [Pisolithus tinctorius Marx 270]
MSTTTTVGFTIPVDVVLIVLEDLELDDLISLSCTCKFLYDVVNEFGWLLYLRRHERQSFTLASARKRWSPLAQVKYNTLADRAWSHSKFVARPLSRAWSGNLQPVLAVSSSRLLVAAGGIIYSYAIHDPFTEGYATRFTYEGSYTFTFGPRTLDCDITNMVFIDDGGENRIVNIGFDDGYVERIDLPPHDSSNLRQRVTLRRAPDKALHIHERDTVESMSYSRNSFLSLSSWGSVALTDLSSPSTTTTTFHLGIRSWSSHLCMTASTPYAAFGITCTASPTPLFLHYILPSGLSPTASLTLHSPHQRPSAVYGITRPPPCSPLGDSDQIVVSGWYDGAVRVHDLRAPEQATSAAGRPTSLKPVLTLQDPWSPEPVYCVSCGGGSASFVAAGTARHSVVAFWDVRQPTKGWSVHAPGNDSSPVYSLILESSRLFGGTQSRSFVYDFGPGVTKDTYPSVPPASHRAIDRHLRPMNDGIDYYVLKYNHNRTDVTYTFAPL